MSPAPIGGARVATMFGKTNFKPLLGLGAIAAAWWMMRDTFDGTRQKRIDAIAAAKEHAEWADMEYGWGHWSGNPGMDHKAHQFKRFLLFGPMNLRMRWLEFKITVDSLVNDVLLKNIVPLGVGVAGIYSMFGARAVNTGVRNFGRFLGQIIPSGFGRAVGSLLSQGLTGLGKGVLALSHTLLSKQALPFTIGAAIFGNYALSRFKDSYGHDGQHEFFRDLTNIKGH